jgi:hypothetical protein
MTRLVICCGGFLIAVSGQIALAEGAAKLTETETAAIKETVRACVQVVHSNPDTFSQGFYAYYNAATGTVENNMIYQAGREPLFRFQKCMAEHGVPLS